MSTSLVYRLPSVGAFQSPRTRPTTLSSVSFPLRSSSCSTTQTSRSSVFSSKIDVLSTKNKVQDLTGKHPDVLESLSPQVRKRLETLRELQNQRDELLAKFFEERAAFEAKYQKLYTKRYHIVNGVVEDEKGVPDFHIVNGGVEVEKGVPDFWLTALKNNKVTAETIYERDEGALKFLKDIKWFRIENPNGFKLEFFFDTNPYFKNSVLTKIYHIFGEHEPTLENAIGMEIEWHAGKCLTQKILKKKPKKGSKNAKPITKTEQCESFFNFFSPPDDEWLLEEDYNIGVTIREEIIPYAVSWFIGEAAEDEFDDMEDTKGDSLDEYEEDEDEDEEEEDDD